MHLHEPQLAEDAGRALDHRLLVPPDALVDDAAVLVLLRADAGQLLDALAPVVLQVTQALVHVVRGAGAQAQERVVVVEGLDAVRAVEALDVEAGLAVLAGAVHVLEHVEVVGQGVEVTVPGTKLCIYTQTSMF